MGAIDIRNNNNLSRLNSKVFLKMKRLKTAKGQSEAVTQRTENTMIRRKRTEGQTTIYTPLHRKPKTE